MYLHDTSGLPGFYAARGWQAKVPETTTMLTKELWQSPSVDLHALEGDQCARTSHGVTHTAHK